MSRLQRDFSLSSAFVATLAIILGRLQLLYQREIVVYSHFAHRLGDGGYDRIQTHPQFFLGITHLTFDYFGMASVTSRVALGVKTIFSSSIKRLSNLLSVLAISGVL